MNPDAAIRQIPLLDGARVIHEMGGSPVTRSFLLDDKSQRVVLRIDTDIAKALQLNRLAEYQILNCLAETGLAPRPLFCDAERGWLVSEFIDGEAWDEPTLCEPPNLARLGARLKVIHSTHCDSLPARLDILDKARCYATLAQARDAPGCVDEIERLLAAIGEPRKPVLCHNDLHAANMIGGAELRFIDWEYAGLADPRFELAVLARQSSLDRVQLKQVLDAYDAAEAITDISALPKFVAVFDRLLYLWLAAVASMTELGAEQAQALQVARDRCAQGPPEGI